MGKKNGDNFPPLDLESAIPIGGPKPPMPTAENCIVNASKGVPSDQVTAMALVGILYHLEMLSEGLSEHFGGLAAISSENQKTLDEYRDRLDAHGRTFDRFAEKTDAMQGYEGAMMEKLDTYRDRLEAAEQKCEALLERGNRLDLELERRGVFGTQDPDGAGE